MTDLATTTTTAPRLPLPAGFDPELWRVLTEAIWPTARESRSILTALAYCKQRGLDPLKKPVNIVPVWNSELGRYTEGFWAGINEIEVTASRTKEWAGMDPPRWGDLITETFEGVHPKSRQKISAEVTYPAFCAVTVYRLVGGSRCSFVEPVYWREAYGRFAGTDVPNQMWRKRPHGQLHKVAKAASLRAAFPEEGDYAAEEMEDQTTAELVPPPAPSPADNWQPPPQTLPPGHDAETGEVGPRDIGRGDTEEPRDWCKRLLDFIRAETELEAVDEWVKANQAHITALTNEAPKLHTQLEAAINRHHMAIIERKEAEQGEQASEQEPPNEREQA